MLPGAMTTQILELELSGITAADYLRGAWIPSRRPSVPACAR
jgi:hypothetical protein